MGLIQWYRKRNARKLASGPLGGQGKFYYLMYYEEEYSALVSTMPDSDEVLAELYLFRFWLTQRTYRLCKPDALTEDEILDAIIPNGMTLGRGMFQRMNGVDIEECLGEDFSEFIEDRFHAYDAVSISEKSASDPFALKAVSRELANHIFDNPSEGTIAYLTVKAEEQFFAIVAIWAGNGKSKATLTIP